jgi:hypothetical protein
MKLDFSRQIFEKSSHIKIHQNPSSGIRDVKYGRTDITKLIVAFHGYANAPKTVGVKTTFFFAVLLKFQDSAMQRSIVGRVSSDVSVSHNAFVFRTIRIYGKYSPVDTASHSE